MTGTSAHLSPSKEGWLGEKQRSVLPTVSRLQAGTVHQILGEGRGGERKGGGEGEGGGRGRGVA